MEMRLTGTPADVERVADWLTRQGRIAGLTVTGVTRHTGGEPGETCATLIVTVSDPEPAAAGARSVPDTL